MAFCTPPHDHHLLAKLDGHIRVKDTDDLVDKFLLLSNAHDGSAALRVLFTPVRVVCQNTLSMALRQGHGEGVRIRHNGDLTTKIREAQRVLGFAAKFYDDAAAKIDRLAPVYPTVGQLDVFYRVLYPDPEDGTDNTRARKTREQLHALFEGGIGHDIKGVKGTWWAAYNSVTEIERDQGNPPEPKEAPTLPPQAPNRSHRAEPLPMNRPATSIGSTPSPQSATPKQLQFLQNLGKRKGLTRDELDAVIAQVLGLAKRAGELTKRDAGQVIDHLTNLQPEESR